MFQVFLVLHSESFICHRNKHQAKTHIRTIIFSHKDKIMVFLVFSWRLFLKELESCKEAWHFDVRLCSIAGCLRWLLLPALIGLSASDTFLSCSYRERERESLLYSILKHCSHFDVFFDCRNLFPIEKTSVSSSIFDGSTIKEPIWCCRG